MKVKNFKKRTIVWGAVTAASIALMVTVGVLTQDAIFGEVFNIVLGGERAQVSDGEEIYKKETTSKEEATAKADEVNIKLNEEGITLLKNKNHALPLASTSKISVFGKNSVNLMYGGSGSSGGSSGSGKTLFDSLGDAGFSVNPSLKSFYEDNTKSGEGRPGNPSIEGNDPNAAIDIGETPLTSYDSTLTLSYSNYKDAALIVFSRIGGEGFDLPRKNDSTGKHYLQLNDNEKDLINHVCSQGFNKVIILINSNNPLELGFLDDPTHYAYNEKIDACLWSGGYGNSGVMAVGKILNGEVNPSGHLTDTYSRDFKKDPSWKNFGANGTEDGDRYVLNGRAKQYYFVEYEEGNYVGYRYYETVAYDLESKSAGAGEDWYKENVVYPMGYGLSYTTFSKEIVNKTALTNIVKGEKLTIQVKVTNTGTVIGKDVAQIYGAAPYTTNGIEKPYEILCGFEKTKLLEPGESQTLSIEVDPYYVASYDYNDKNNNDFKGYELEKGSYDFSVNSDAHAIDDHVSISLAEDIKYEKDTTTGYEVKNRFEEADDTIETFMSRSDIEGTFPTTPTDEERNVTSEFLTKLQSTETTNPISETEISVTGKNNGMSLYDLVGKEYDDPLWERLLEQPSTDEMLNMYNKGAFKTEKITSIDKPITNDADGPQGFAGNFMAVVGDYAIVYGTCKYASEPVIGATWNKELLSDMGKALGEEGLWGNVRGDGLAYTGIYAPGLNIHRSQFGGRNGEYYSEDGYLNGVLGAAFTKGAASKGVYTYAKHFALNEQETHRAVNGDCTWANEQSIREIYLRPFEIIVKEGGTTGIMSSFNRIGYTWTGGDYNLCTEVLRNEWGFKGSVICDFNTNPNYMNARQMAYAGGDLNLCTQSTSYWADFDKNNANDVAILKNATHNTLYSVANSNAMNKFISGYSMAVWRIVMYCVFGAISAGLAVWGGFTIFGLIKSKKKVN